jgi:LysR family nitrogen assimilation transcriptional regulator
MDSRLLEYFLRTTELGSINRAAADLHLSQPALSRHIGNLEHEMGAKLFTRAADGVKLTDAGKLLADRARPLLRHFGNLKDQVAQTAAGQLAIGIPPSLEHVFTADFVVAMQTQCPEVSLRVFEGVSHILREHMLAGVLDLCVMPFDMSTPMGYAQTPIMREPMVLVCQPGAGLAGLPAVPLSRVNALKLVMPGKANVLRVQLENALVRKGMRFQLAVETDTLALCLTLARVGVGATVVPACALYGHTQGDALEWAPIKGLSATWALLTNQARVHSQAVRQGQALVGHCLSTGALSGQRGTEILTR